MVCLYPRYSMCVWACMHGHMCVSTAAMSAWLALTMTPALQVNHPIPWSDFKMPHVIAQFVFWIVHCWVVVTLLSGSLFVHCVCVVMWVFLCLWWLECVSPQSIAYMCLSYNVKDFCGKRARSGKLVHFVNENIENFWNDLCQYFSSIHIQ